MSFIPKMNAEFEQTLSDTDPTAQWNQLNDGMIKNKMLMFGKPFPSFLRPYFVDWADRERIAYSTRMMLSCIEKVGKAFMSGYDFKGIIHQEGRMAEMTKVDPLYGNYQVVVRLDVFFDPVTKSIKFLEFNCGDPSGMGWNDAMVQTFLDLPAVEKMKEKYEIIPDWLLDTHENAMMKMYRNWCEAKGRKAKDKPPTAIVCWDESTILDDFDLIVQRWNDKGFPCVFSDPSGFKYDGKVLTKDGMEIELIYRDAITDFFQDEFWPNCQDVLNAYRDGNVCFVNPVRAATGDFKTLPGLLLDPRFAELFTEEERAAAKEFIPFTHIFKKGETAEYDGKKDVDLVKLVRENKDMFVLKPNEGYGGFGIFIGPSCDQKEWENAVEKALTPPNEYACQEFVEIPTDRFPVMEGDQLKGWVEKNVNINFWSHAGEFAGAFLRAADGTLINVHQGGGLVPVFFAKEK